jgi:hypothetical protein
MIPAWVQTNIIFVTSTKNWVDLCEFEIVSATFFSGQIFPPGPFQGYVKKYISSKSDLNDEKRVLHLWNAILGPNDYWISNK